MHYFAQCRECHGASAMPFGPDEDARDEWVSAHSQVIDPFTGNKHTVGTFQIADDAPTGLVRIIDPECKVHGRGRLE